METITAYKTTDGQLHECKDTATKEQSRLNLERELGAFVKEEV